LINSGFESLINSTAENSEAEASSSLWGLKDDGKRENFAHFGGICRREEEPMSRLGAIPKRRSPRQIAMGNKIDGIERLTRIKTGKRNLNIDQEADKLLADNKNRFSVPDLEKYNSRKNLVMSSIHVSKEGRETCDILRYLYERNISEVLGNVFKYLAPRDLCRVAQVSFVKISWTLS
jgi:hypothetical protein